MNFSSVMSPKTASLTLLFNPNCANCFMNSTASLPDSTAYTVWGLAAAIRAMYGLKSLLPSGV